MFFSEGEKKKKKLLTWKMMLTLQDKKLFLGNVFTEKLNAFPFLTKAVYELKKKRTGGKGE